MLEIVYALLGGESWVGEGEEEEEREEERKVVHKQVVRLYGL